MSEYPHTLNSIAEQYNVSRSTVRNWVLSGKLEAVRLPGGHYRISQAAVDAFNKRLSDGNRVNDVNDK